MAFVIYEAGEDIKKDAAVFVHHDGKGYNFRDEKSIAKDDEGDDIWWRLVRSGVNENG
jgi:hypothetical protein